VAFGHMRRSPVGHVLVQITLYPAVETFLLLVEFVARELDFNKKETILFIYNKKVWRLRMCLTYEVCRFVTEYLNSLEI